MKFKNILLCSLLFFAMSCAIFQKAQAPKADSAARQMTKNLSDEILSFYSILAVAPDKTYNAHAGDYDSPNNSIRTLAVYDSSRKHSEGLMIIVHDMENRFHVYQAEHKTYGKLNAAQISSFKEGMDAQLDILITTENHYK